MVNRIQEEEANIEVPSIIESAKDVYAIPVKVTKDAIVTLGDIATIKRTFKDFTSYARVNGEDAVTLEISLRESANAIDASNAIRDILYSFEKTLPSNLNIVVSNDDTIYANLMVKELNGNIIAAVVLIMVLVIASMGTRVSMLVGLSIPFCFLMTYLILYTLDMEVNFLVMMGLLLGMGMLIDGSIVITEYADKKIAEGLSRVEGYTLASKRMFLPDNRIDRNDTCSLHSDDVLAWFYWSIYEVSSHNYFLCFISFLILFINSDSSSWCIFWTKRICFE